MERSDALPPVFDARARVLVLGSLPGTESLARARYYAHPRNAFWRLIGAAIGVELTPLSYDARLAALVDARVALGDVIASANRRGSLDAAIRNETVADLAALIAQLPELRAVAFNGAKPAKLGRVRLAATPGPILIDLPSSSPSYAAMPFEAKRLRWSVLAAHLR